MTWWAWVLIWTGLAVLLLATVTLLLWRLFRKAMTLLDDVGTLAERAEFLDIEDMPLPAQTIAVLADVRDIRARESARKAHRARRRSERHRVRIARARRITSVDASTRSWPTDWY
ncbi:MAG: hypothetical protein KF761_09005 [Salinibacterium sp.]|nr:hypothetical protein [Salinibacterium sp.]